MLLDDEMMREILRDVGSMRTAIELELWASWMLGQSWRQRTRIPLFQEIDAMLVVSVPLVSMIAEIGGVRARKALSAISMLDRGSLGTYAGAIALTLPGSRTPGWMTDIAEARLSNARLSDELDNVEVILFDLCRHGEAELTIAMLIDYGADGIIRWIHLLDPIPEYLEIDGEVAEPLPGLDLATTAARVRDAFAKTDREARPEVDPSFTDLRAFVLARVIDACKEDDAPSATG